MDRSRAGNQTVEADCILRGEYILPMDRDFMVINDGAVVVKAGKVLEVGQSEDLLSRYSTKHVTEGKGRVIIPGLINGHTHAAMVFFRGLADDLPLKEWLEEHIWPAESRWLSPGFVSDAIRLACLEMLKAGITVYNDMYFFGDAAGTATKAMGMRAVLGVGILDFPSVAAKTIDEYFAKAEDFISRWKGDTYITPSIAPHALYTCGPETLKRARKVADSFDIPIHIHLSETNWEVNEIMTRYGKRPVHYLESLGFLDEKVLAAHCVWLDDEEISIMARSGAAVAHCVESNLKLASGFAPVARMLKAGVRVTFGTDGAASNNDLDILSEMATAAKLHKAASGDPTVLNARTVLLMATRWGAEVLGLGSSLGSIERGKHADLVVMNLDKPHLTPLYDIYSHIVYSMRAADVEKVLIGGRIVVDNGRLVTGDEAEILSRARYWGGRIRGGESHATHG